MINFDIFQILQTLFCKIRDKKLKKLPFGLMQSEAAVVSTAASLPYTKLY